jgi:uncharacterized NAD(P)/FAD-binding protein YdhS
MSDWAVRLNLEVREGLDDPLAVIGGIVDSSGGIESALREWVRIARTRGHTWQEVADALRVTRQSAWERFKEVSASPSTNSDPAFASAVERAYLRELSEQQLDPSSDLAAIHRELLAGALYAADRTNGGLRFKKLAEAPELEARMRRALALLADR